MNSIINVIQSAGIVPVINLSNPDSDAEPLSDALVKGGIKIAEVTFRSANADKAIRLMKTKHPDMIVGAGTVLTKEQVDLAVEAGVSFVVTPGFDPDLVDYCKSINLLIIPGCCTASEWQAAIMKGLECIKFFPAETSGGLKSIKALLGPFPNMKVMPTGGISINNLADYIRNPSIIACGGSYMVTKDLISSNDWDSITKLCADSVEIVRKGRLNG